MAIFQDLQSQVTPMQPMSAPELGPSYTSALNSLSGLFLSAPKPTGSMTEKDKYAASIDEHRQRIGNENWTPATSTFSELQGFGVKYPEFSSIAIGDAKTALNPEVAAAETEYNSQTDFLKSPQGVYAIQLANQVAETNPAKARSIVSNAQADYLKNNAMAADLQQQASMTGDKTTLANKAWDVSKSQAKTEADVLGRAVTELMYSFTTNPTQSINIGEIAGGALIGFLPNLRGNEVINRENLPSMLSLARASLEDRFTNLTSDISTLGKADLGTAPEDWSKEVFKLFDTQAAWATKNLDPTEMKKRLENNAMLGIEAAGVPLSLMTVVNAAAGNDPSASAAFMSAFTGAKAQLVDYLEAGEYAKAKTLLNESSNKDLTDARAAFIELALIMGGKSDVAVPYQEVIREQRDIKLVDSTAQAVLAHKVLQERSGEPQAWSADQWRQSFEEVNAQFNRGLQLNTAYRDDFIKFFSSDVALTGSAVRDSVAALNEQYPNVGFTLTYNKAGGVSIGLAKSIKEAFPNVREGDLKVLEADINNSVQSTNRKAAPKLEALNYKLSVLNGLGDVGSSAVDIIGAELGLDLTGSAVPVPTTLPLGTIVPSEGAMIAGDTRQALDATATQSQPVRSAFDLVRNLEGYRENSYYDVNAYRTGYGSDTVTKEDGTVVKVSKGTTVTRAEAERDLARRLADFNAAAERKVSTAIWSNLDEPTRAALTSIAYNYGSIPDRLMEAIQSTDNELIAAAVETLAGDNSGVNRDRRMQEAEVIRSGQVKAYVE